MSRLPIALDVLNLEEWMHFADPWIREVAAESGFGTLVSAPESHDERVYSPLGAPEVILARVKIKHVPPPRGWK